MSQEIPKVLYGADDPRHARVRRFVGRLFAIEESGKPLLGIEQVARKELGLADATDGQVKATIRYVAANFFSIFGVEQPKTSKQYNQIMDAIRKDIAKDIDEEQA